jgi:hypothetical protein
MNFFISYLRNFLIKHQRMFDRIVSSIPLGYVLNQILCMNFMRNIIWILISNENGIDPYGH